MDDVYDALNQALQGYTDAAIKSLIKCLMVMAKTYRQLGLDEDLTKEQKRLYKEVYGFTSDAVQTLKLARQHYQMMVTCIDKLHVYMNNKINVKSYDVFEGNAYDLLACALLIFHKADNRENVVAIRDFLWGLGGEPDKPFQVLVRSLWKTADKFQSKPLDDDKGGDGL